MTRVLSRPLPSRALLGLALVLVLALGLYCLAYNAAQGRVETVWNAFSWPVVNLLPFLAAFELGKRRGRWRERVAVLAGAALFSLLLDRAASGPLDPGFELVRRLPAIAVVLAALLIGDRLGDAAPRETEPAMLPLLPGQIDWVSASGNYVVLHGNGRTVLHRATLSQVERSLARHDFVRVHRSRLVRRGAVARVRSVDVVLHDGTSIATGARFRPAIDRQTG